MNIIKETAGHVVAADTQASIEALDSAIIAHARQCASVVEVSHASKMPVSTCQALLSDISQALGLLVSSREKTAEATRKLLKIQQDSSLQTVNFGCPGGFFKPSAQVHNHDHAR